MKKQFITLFLLIFFLSFWANLNAKEICKKELEQDGLEHGLQCLTPENNDPCYMLAYEKGLDQWYDNLKRSLNKEKVASESKYLQFYEDYKNGYRKDECASDICTVAICSRAEKDKEYLEKALSEDFDFNPFAEEEEAEKTKKSGFSLSK